MTGVMRRSTDSRSAPGCRFKSRRRSADEDAMIGGTTMARGVRARRDGEQP
jgi:hypothetical protein